MEASYQKQFLERDSVTPTDPLEYHLYHLTLYWSRLLGFCQNFPEEPVAWIEGDLGACVMVGTKAAELLIGDETEVLSAWKKYEDLTRQILYKRPVCLEQVEHCLLYTSPSPRDQRGSRMPSSA